MEGGESVNFSAGYEVKVRNGYRSTYGVYLYEEINKLEVELSVAKLEQERYSAKCALENSEEVDD